VSYKLPIFLF